MTFEEWWQKQLSYVATDKDRLTPMQLAEAAFNAGVEEGRVTYVQLGDGRDGIQVRLTDEGVIMDIYHEDDQPCATMGMTYDEWFVYVNNNDPSEREDIEGVWE